MVSCVDTWAVISNISFFFQPRNRFPFLWIAFLPDSIWPHDSIHVLTMRFSVTQVTFSCLFFVSLFSSALIKAYSRNIGLLQFVLYFYALISLLLLPFHPVFISFYLLSEYDLAPFPACCRKGETSHILVSDLHVTS